MELECTLTLKRIFNESIDRGIKFEKEYRALTETIYHPHDSGLMVNKLRYLKDNMIRCKRRALGAQIELQKRNNFR